MYDSTEIANHPSPYSFQQIAKDKMYCGAENQVVQNEMPQDVHGQEFYHGRVTTTAGGAPLT